MSKMNRIMVVVCLLLAGSTAYASPCARLKSRPEAWVTTKIDALVRAAHAAYEDEDTLESYQRVLGGIAGTIRRCGLSQDEGFVSRYKEFVEYVEAASISLDPDHELGFVVPDQQYFEETRQYSQIPEFLLSQSFLRAVSRYETLNKAKSFLRQFNANRDASDQLIFFSYKSRHLGTPDNDNSFIRLLIVVPGKAADGVPEKWVQFGIPDPRARVRTRNVSVVSALAASNDTSNIYFKDYYRTYRRNGLININGRWELGYGDDDCVRCHKMGILPIFPVEGSVSVGEQPAVLAVNQRLLTYGTPRFDKYLDTSKFGPGLGAASSHERQQRFGDRFDGTVVAHAMTCSACHRQEWLGSFNWPMDKVSISSFITGGQMPLGYTLQESERNELHEKLIREYFAIDKANPGILKSWLSGRLR
jgi:hypothetical protein